MQVYCQPDYKAKALSICAKHGLTMATTMDEETVYLYVGPRLGFFMPKFKKPFIPEYNYVNQHVLTKIFAGFNQILDLTFGFGKDATILATKGRQIIGLEKNFFTYLIGKDYVANCGLNMQLIHQDSMEYLQSLKGDVPAIYLDPMRVYTSKAANSKPMAILQMLHENTVNYFDLLELARSKCSGIVVLKVHKKDNIPACDRIIKGKNTNFAIYSNAQSSKKIQS